MGIVRARQLSRATMSNIRQNLVFAFIYNVAGIPIAAGVLYPVFGWLPGLWKSRVLAGEKPCHGSLRVSGMVAQGGCDVGPSGQAQDSDGGVA